MDKATLRKVQLCQLDLALEVKRICDKYNIAYFIVDGTALGAVKYNGFIPWDDDLDIGMMREDYYRFADICKTELSEEYFLQNYNTDEFYGNCFSQLRIRNTEYSQKIWGGRNLKNGIFIDIHPFIPVPDNEIRVKLLSRYFLFQKTSLLLKNGAEVNRRLTSIICLINKLRRRKGIIRSIDRIFNKYSTDKCSKALKISGRHRDKDFIYINNLKNLKEISFEGQVFKIMPDYDRMLSAVYGDYLNTIPDGDLENRHGITNVDFGTYEIKNK